MNPISSNDVLQCRYHRGFLFSPINQTVTLIENWKSYFISDFSLQCAPEYNCDYIIEDSSFLILIGRTLSNNKDIQNSSVIHLLYEKLSRSEDDFFESLDELNGRYAIIYRGKDGIVKVLNDACGMRSVFYSKKRKNFFSSHPSLLADTINAKKNGYGGFLTKYSCYYLPGNITTYEDIYQLIPNHYLNTDTSKLVRFFPKMDLLPANDIVGTRKKLSDYLANQVNTLSLKYNILCSISAGIDSRVSLAASKNAASKIDFFTYYGGKGEGHKILSIDQQVVSDIALNLNLNHEFFELPYSHSKAAVELQTKFLQESHITHQASIALEFINRYRHKNYLHIRSNLLEIGRAFYRDHYNIKSENLSVETALLCYSEKAKNDEEIISLFKEFFEEVSYDNLPSGYDPFDLFYWEYRMGTWHSLILLESDPAFDTHILFNNRYFLKELLSIPHNIRKENRFYLSMCEDNWPILSNWGVNNKHHSTSSYDHEIHTPKNSIPFDNALFISGSNKKNTNPDFLFVKKDFSARFNLADSAPLKGDFVSFVLPIKVVDTKKLVINLRTPFANPILPGRMAVAVEINGQEYWTNDVSSWKETQQIIIDLMPNTYELKISSIALKNCEGWSWGKAGSIIIERITLV